jgi:hypothetical protein
VQAVGGNSDAQTLQLWQLRDHTHLLFVEQTAMKVREVAKMNDVWALAEQAGP